MNRLLHRLLYRVLPLEGYLRTVSGLCLLGLRLGLGRRSAATEYIHHLPRLAGEGDTVVDIGANLGYYTRPLARLVGPGGQVYAVEPVAPIRRVLERNVRRCRNVRILPYALGAEERTIRMGNDSVRERGYFGTGRNFVDEQAAAGIAFTAEMRRGSELFGGLERLDLIKCDIEGYELTVMREMQPLLERHRPRVLVESGGANRPEIIRLFTGLGYRGFTLEHGREIPLGLEDNGKDLIFRPRHEC